MMDLVSRLARFRAVIFDFDGVIVDSETMQARAWTRVARELGLRGCDITVAQIAGRIDHELVAELFPGCDGPACMTRKCQIDDELESDGELRHIPGIEPLLRALAVTHALAICSSCDAGIIARRLERVGLSWAFPVVMGRTDGVPHKPAPDLYRRALGELRASAADACAIEDSPTGIAAAKSAGLYAIQLLHPGMPRAADADEWIDSLVG
jgi:HAD superfamily hydrolase (TIGR01509 family)